MSLATRLIILLVVPFALCVTAFGMSTIRLRRALMLSEAEREIRDDGTALQLTFDTVLHEQNPAQFSPFAEDLSKAADRILGVLFFDGNGNLLGASRSVEGYRDALKPLAQRVHGSGRAEVHTYDFRGVLTYAQAMPTGRYAVDDAGHGVAIILRDLGYIERNLADFTRQIVFVAASIILALTFGIWLLLRKNVTQPLSLLVGGVERVAAGDLTVAAPVKRADEIGRLASAFNHMTASLRRTAEELEVKGKTNLALERRLQHAQRLTLIGQLAASIAHQIGSPLNVILGRAQYALKLGGQSERDQRHFQEIAMGAERVSRIIEQLLSQARKARGPVVAVDIGLVIRETVGFLSAELDRCGIATSVEAELGIFVEGRRDELEQVILNLCLNAIQAQPQGGRLALAAHRVAERGADVQVDVIDEGPGVQSDLRELIFEPFFTTKANEQGTGLGLAICDEMVRRQGGTIAVSEAPGGGALFRITLPRYGVQASKSVPETS
ncbi:MAG TPA: HAMP domain-containing sensor histidine kinase [Polyangiaceae bacterium]|nr:HAMP domain-containing sensor histidine kinase [Polyangiaceae bacterium]